MASILTNAAVASAGRLLNGLLGIVVVGLLTRLLGTEQFGNYALIISYGTILQIIADGGLYLTLTREIAAHPDREQRVLARVVSLRLVLLAAAFTVGGLVIPQIPPLRGLLPAYIVVTVGLAFQSLSQLAMGAYQKYGAMWRATIGDLMGRLVQIAAIVALSVGNGTLGVAVVAFTLGTAAAALLHRQLLPALRSIRPTASVHTWQMLLQSSWPLAAILVLNVIYFRIDMLVLALFRAPSEVGLYSAAYRLIESGLFFPAMFGGLLLPYLSRAWQRQQKKYSRQLIEQALSLLLLGATFAVVVLNLKAEPIITLIAGTDFAAAAPLLQILSFALAVMFLGNLFGFVLIATRQQMVLLKLYAVLALASLLVNLVFIPRWGALAAASTTVATESVAALVAAIVVWKDVRYTVSPTFVLRLALVALLTAAVLTLLPHTWHVIITVLAAAATFLAAAALVRLINPHKVRLLIRDKHTDAAL